MILAVIIMTFCGPDEEKFSDVSNFIFFKGFLKIYSFFLQLVLILSLAVLCEQG